MIHAYQSAQLGRVGRVGAGPDVIRHRFQAMLVDEGFAESVWSTGGGSMVLSTSLSPALGSWLRITTNGSALSTPWSAANAISGSGEWFVGFDFRMTGTITSAYIASVQNAGATAAGTALAWVLNASNQLLLVVSDGTTRTVHNTGKTIVADTTYYCGTERVGNTIYPSIDGSLGTTLAFSGSLNLPAGQSLQLGAANAGGTSTSLYIGRLQIRRASRFGGAGFTVPSGLA